MAKFRFHRGALKESLKTEVEVFDFRSLCKTILTEMPVEPFLFHRRDVLIRPYGFDERVDRHLYLVTMHGYPCGFLYYDKGDRNFIYDDTCRVDKA